jgi:hypothetical protein
MVMHWRKNRGPHWLKKAFVNGLGAIVTGITVVVVLVAKFVKAPGLRSFHSIDDCFFVACPPPLPLGKDAHGVQGSG